MGKTKKNTETKTDHRTAANGRQQTIAINCYRKEPSHKEKMKT